MTVLHQRPASLPRSRACDALGLSRTGTYPRTRPAPPKVRKPQPRALDAAERQAVRELLHSEDHQDDSVRVVHAKELNAGRILASVSTMYRLLRTTGETRERRRQRPPQRHPVPRLSVTAPNQAWTWDITKLPTFTPKLYLNLYVILDLFSRFPVGWMISRKENAALAKHLFAQALQAHAIEPGQLTVHQDRGAPMIAHTYHELLESFGVTVQDDEVCTDVPGTLPRFRRRPVLGCTVHAGLPGATARRLGLLHAGRCLPWSHRHRACLAAGGTRASLVRSSREVSQWATGCEAASSGCFDQPRYGNLY